MNIKIGNLYTIQGITYYALDVIDNYALMLNSGDKDIEGSGKVVLVKEVENNVVKPVKDKVEIKKVVDLMIRK